MPLFTNFIEKVRRSLVKQAPVFKRFFLNSKHLSTTQTDQCHSVVSNHNIHINHINHTSHKSLYKKFQKSFHTFCIIFGTLIYSLLLFFSVNLKSYADIQTPSSQESLEITRPTTLRVGWSSQAPYLDFSGPFGEYQGLDAEFLHQITDSNGIVLRHSESTSIKENLSALDKGTIDLIPGVFWTQALAEKYWLSDPYTLQPVGLITQAHRFTTINLSALSGKTIATETGSAWQSFISRHVLHVNFLYLPNTHAALEAVLKKQADAYIGFKNANDVLIKLSNQPKLVSLSLNQQLALRFAVNKKNRSVQTFLQQGLLSLTLQQRQEIESNWAKKNKQNFDLPIKNSSEQEKYWIKKNKLLRVGIYNPHRPYDYLDTQGKWHGLGAEILQKFAAQKGIELSLVLLSPLDNPLESVMQKRVNIIAAMPVDNIPENIGLATLPYDHIRWSMIEALQKKTSLSSHIIATVPWRANTIIPRIIPENAHILAVRTSADALAKVAEGASNKAFVDIQTASDYIAKNPDILKLVPNQAPLIERVGFVVNPKDQILAGMLNRFIESIAPQELAHLSESSHIISLPVGYGFKKMMQVAMPIAAAIMLIMSLLLYVNHKTSLAKQIAEKSREQAMQANQAKSFFLATMSHEIRTPMGGVIGVIDLLNSTSLNADQHQLLNTANRAARMLLRIIDDALDYSKIDAGKLELEIAPFDITKTIEHIIALYDAAAHKKGLRLINATMPHFDHFVLGDEIRISQILANLINNAIKFVEQGSVLIYARKRITKNGPPIVDLFVQDTGPGIPDEYQKSLFLPFTQENISTQRKYGGTGLGLAIVKQLIELMKGSISVKSSLGNGTTMKISLPLALGNPIEKTYFPYGQKIRICIDNRREKIALSALVKKMGFTLSPYHDHSSSFAITQDNAGFLNLQTQAGILCRIESRQQLIDTLSNQTKQFSSASSTALSSPSTITLSPTSITPTPNFITHQAQQKTIATPPPKLPFRFKKPVLIVEDVDMNREILARQLEAVGLVVEVAEDGEQGLNLWQSSLPELMLIDCNMPKLNGYELTKKIRALEKQNGLSPTIIIATTAYTLENQKERCLEAGMTDVVSKPITQKKLLTILEQWAV